MKNPIGASNTVDSVRLPASVHHTDSGTSTTAATSPTMIAASVCPALRQRSVNQPPARMPAVPKTAIAMPRRMPAPEIGRSCTRTKYCTPQIW